MIFFCRGQQELMEVKESSVVKVDVDLRESIRALVTEKHELKESLKRVLANLRTEERLRKAALNDSPENKVLPSSSPKKRKRSKEDQSQPEDLSQQQEETKPLTEDQLNASPPTNAETDEKHVDKRVLTSY